MKKTKYSMQVIEHSLILKKENVLAEHHWWERKGQQFAQLVEQRLALQSATIDMSKVKISACLSGILS